MWGEVRCVSHEEAPCIPPTLGSVLGLPWLCVTEHGRDVPGVKGYVLTPPSPSSFGPAKLL